MLNEELWNLAYKSFKQDDGSLPTLELQGLTREEVALLYAAIRRDSILVTPATFWDLVSQHEEPIDGPSNAALLVSTGKAAPFHFLVDGVSAGGTGLPRLGIHVFQDIVAIDYRMGPEWNTDSVRALFDWLCNLLAQTRAGRLVPASNEGPPDANGFMAAWALYLREQGRTTP